MNDQQSIEHIVKETCGACMGSDSDEKWRCNICGYKKAIEALEKQIPKKPMLTQLADPEYMCECGMKYWRKGGVKYCIECGQKLDWSVDDGK